MKYFAHSHPSQSSPGDRWQPLTEHLRGVAKLAQQFASDMFGKAAAGDEARTFRDTFQKAARAAGLLHDLGKYRDEFQQRIQGLTQKKVPHAIHGAVWSARLRAVDVALAIAGHHAGIPSLSALKSVMSQIDADSVWSVACRDMDALGIVTERIEIHPRSRPAGGTYLFPHDDSR